MNNLRRLLTGSLCFLFICTLQSCNKDKFTLEDLPVAMFLYPIRLFWIQLYV